MNSFKADVEEIRRRAMEKMDKGAVTASYAADAEKVIAVLNEVLATETVCTLRYRSHYFKAKGVHAPGIEDEFLEHAKEEQEHADKVAKRIAELGGTPNLNPEGLAKRSHAEYGTGESLNEMIKEDLVAERIAVATYSEIIRWIGNDDPTTRRMMEELLAKEEEHADDMAKLLSRLSS
ncbi:MAG: ferritin-like domain-containing protein [Kofleriaceae bacterium]